MFSYAHIGAITGGTFTAVEGDLHTHYNASGDFGLGGIRLLHGHIAVGAFHNSAERFDPPKCHPSTRKSILKRIMDWVKDDDKTHPFLWLYGPAGSGKTSIAQSIAELCEEEGILAGDFFFSRTSPGRNDDRHLIPTLAYQLTISIPGIREYMVEALDRDALVFSRSIKAQLETLIVKPLTELLASSRKKGILTKRQPGLIIIDGLDECGQPKSQRYILSVLSSVMKESNIPLFFFIASRAEQDIRDVFNGQEMCSLSHRLVLDDTCDPDADVRIFLESRFEEIKKAHPSGSFLPARWPHYSDIDRLVRKSSGQFIYASTVLKFVESSRHWPPDRLNIIFGLTPPGANTPFAELDALYTHILSSVEDIERVLEVFSFLFFKESNVKCRMDLVESFLFFRRGELQMVLSDLHSIIYVPPPGDGSRSLRMYHASLRDFLMDKSRSGRFSLDAGLAYARLAMYCIKHMTFPRLTSAPSLLRLTGYTGLMQYCMNAYPTAALLEGLYQFNFEAFLGLRIKTENDVALRGFFHILPSFFEWIRAQRYPNDKNDLYDRYLAHFDGYLKAKLSEYPRKPTTLHFFTASTLNGFDVYSRYIFYILALTAHEEYHDSYKYHLMRIDGDLLHLGSAFKMRKVWAGYYSMINDFFTNAERSAMYHVSASRYRDLAMFFVDILADQNNPFPKFHLQDDKIESAALDLLLAILSRIPMDSELTKYLQAKPIERGAGYFSNLEKRRDVALEIKGYIKKQECIIAEVSNLESDMATPSDVEKNDSPSTQPENLTEKLPTFWIQLTRNWLPSWLEGT